MSTYNEGPNTKPTTCRECGAPLPPGTGIVFSVWGYPWDGSDGEGSITQGLARYTICQHATQCAARAVERGTNVAALQRIARDRENLGDLAAQAATILHEYSQLAQDKAHTADLVAREAGCGAIGGYRG